MGQEQCPSETEILLEFAKAGDGQAREALIEHSCERLRQLTSRMLRFQFPGLRRWEDTSDVLQLALMRLHRTLDKVQPNSTRHFFSLAATHIRWELIDLSRRYFGPEGVAANHESVFNSKPGEDDAPRTEAVDNDTEQPANLIEWTEFHERVDQLPDEEREIFDLLWYQQLSQEDAAAVLDVSLRTVKRRWQRAKLLVHTSFNGQQPA